jgi:hypothetical protein
MVPLGWALWRRGRVSALPTKIKGVAAIRGILAESQTLALPQEEVKPAYDETMVGYAAVEKART